MTTFDDKDEKDDDSSVNEICSHQGAWIVFKLSDIKWFEMIHRIHLILEAFFNNGWVLPEEMITWNRLNYLSNESRFHKKEYISERVLQNFFEIW